MDPKPIERDELLRQAEAITTQARWLYELHAKRTESAQQRATAIIALAGVLLTLAPKAITGAGYPWQVSLLLITQGCAITTIVLALMAFRLMKTQVPSSAALRLTWKDYRTVGSSDPIAQVAEDLLRSTDMRESSMIDFARQDADKRMERLKRSYWALFLTLGLTGALATLAVLQGV